MIVLFTLLAIAAYFDIRSRRIPNVLVLIGFSVAVVRSLIAGSGFVETVLAGCLVGFVMFLPFYLLRMMGAGDVKLLSVTGAFLGVKGVMLSSLFAAVAGGVLALGSILLGLRQDLPYAVAILLGVAGYLLASVLKPVSLLWFTGS